MIDNQQIMSVDVSSQNTMALKTLSPVGLKETNLYSLQNGDDKVNGNGLSESEVEDFGLHLEKEDPLESCEEKFEVPMVPESEDEILNKFDTTDHLLNHTDSDINCSSQNGKEIDPETEEEILNKFDSIDATPSDTVAEDKLLEDSDLEPDINHTNGIEASTESKDQPDTNLDLEKEPEETDTILELEKDPEEQDAILDLEKAPEEQDTISDLEKNPEKPDTILDLEKDTVSQIEESTNDKLAKEEIDLTETRENESELVIEADTTVSEAQEPTITPLEDSNKQEDDNADRQAPSTDEIIIEDKSNENESHEIAKDESSDKSKEEQDAELLKHQIMDTEDLLQIIEDNKDTPIDAETDHEHDADAAEHEHDDDSDIDKQDEEFTIDDDQHSREETDNETKDASEMDIEVEESEHVPISESDNNSDIAISNENSISSADKDDGMIIDDKSVEADCDMKEPETPEENDALSEITSTITDDNTAKLTEETRQRTPKRTLSDTDSELDCKKPKLGDSKTEYTKSKLVNVEEPKTVESTSRIINTISALGTFSDYMRDKTLKKLSRAHLEEFCLQKMCEGIFHKSEVGELRHQLGVQEQMIEMWRKEVVQLTKQARDLEIVNKRLLCEVRQKNDREKPLIPVKITRSVGLQVRSDSIVNMVTPKRKTPSKSQPGSIIQTIAPTVTKAVNKIAATPVTATKPATTTPPNAVKLSTKIITSKANVLLSQALANTSLSSIKSPIKTVTTTPLRVIPVKTPIGKSAIPKVAAVVTQGHPIKAADRTFIDLTDEEDKRPQSLSLVTASPTTTGVRIVKASPGNVVTTTAVGNPPRIMYVYNNQLHQGVLATTDGIKPGAQKLMLKLNPNMMTGPNSMLSVPGGPLTMGTQQLRPGQPIRFASPVTAVRNSLAAPKSVLRHPAPLPPVPASQQNIVARKPIPPKPHLTIRRSNGGIVLSWKMPYNLDVYEAIASYQLFAYQETSALPNSDMWRKVGDVKALALPMACTLTQFADGNKYHFAVRAVDVHKRLGQFSDPEQILL